MSPSGFLLAAPVFPDHEGLLDPLVAGGMIPEDLPVGGTLTFEWYTVRPPERRVSEAVSSGSKGTEELRRS